MALPAPPPLELRQTPPGVDQFAHRGAENLIRVLHHSFLRIALVPSMFTPDPDDANVPCLPAYIVEGLFARLVNATDDALATTFGNSMLSVDMLCAVDIVMKRANTVRT